MNDVVHTLSTQAAAACAAERFEEALDGARKALAHNPQDSYMLRIAGLSAAKLGLFEEAERLWTMGLAIDPKDHQCHTNLGVLYIKQKRFSEAETVYRTILAFDPGNAESYDRLGHIFEAIGRIGDAEKSYRIALAIEPNRVEFHMNLGGLLKKLERYDEALDCYRKVIELRPDFADGYFYLGNTLCDMERFAEAEPYYRMVLKLKPDYMPVHTNFAILCRHTRRYIEAETYFRKAISLQPDHAQSYGNLGVFYVRQARFQEAEMYYRKAIELQPDNVDIIFNLSYLLLLQGRMDEGWPMYEARYDTRMKYPACGTPHVPYPQWRGDDLTGKTVLMWHEQGFGDVMQFVRYASVLKARGAARISLVCEKPLYVLLQTVPYIDQVFVSDDLKNLPLHDYWTLLFSIPLYCRTTVDTIPAPRTYMAALPERVKKWSSRLPAKGKGLRVGIVWKACAKHSSSLERALPSIRMLQPLWQVPGVSFVSLQKNEGEEELVVPSADQPILNLGPELGDFADTAAIISQLDLVICVDTAVLHVAGALGKPVWIMLPWVADWRWLQEREDSPWYPSARLFRQKQEHGWSEVVERVTKALKQKVEASEH